MRLFKFTVDAFYDFDTIFFKDLAVMSFTSFHCLLLSSHNFIIDRFHLLPMILK